MHVQKPLFLSINLFSVLIFPNCQFHSEHYIGLRCEVMQVFVG